MSPLLLTELLLGISLMLQTTEYLFMQDLWSDEGVWTWQVLKADLPKPIAWLLKPNIFRNLLFLQFTLLLLLPLFDSAWLSLLVFAIFMLNLIRWRGAFNGGSDFMSLMVLLGLILIEALPQGKNYAGFWLIAIQLIFSYFFAGLAKIKRPSWRSGEALSGFLKIGPYRELTWLTRIANTPKICQVLAWAVMLFELSFPLAIVNQKFCLVYMSLGLLFHLANFFIFGLNRFLWAWLAAYPSLYFLAFFKILRH